MIRLVALSVLSLFVLTACNDGGEEAVALAELDCAAAASLDSYHLSSRTDFVVAETGNATPTATDLTPFNVAWVGEMDYTDGGENAMGVITTIDTGREEVKNVIVVGPNNWVAFSDRPNAYIQGASGGSIPFPPGEICVGLSDDLDLTQMTGESESVDGVAGMKYEIEGLESTALSNIPSIGPGGDAVNVIKEYSGTIWVANEGYISKLDLAGHGEYEGGRRVFDVTFFFEFSDVNDVDVEIVAPQPLAGQ